jgi:hypothetical protein
VGRGLRDHLEAPHPSTPRAEVSPSQARAKGALASAPGARHIFGAMAGSSMRKLRKTGAVDPDGNVVTIPRSLALRARLRDGAVPET